MKASSVLRITIILYWILIFLPGVRSVIMPLNLPPELQVLQESSFAPPGWLLYIVLPLIILTLVANIALFLLHRWGAYLYLITYLSFIVLNLVFLGLNIDDAFGGESVSEISSILDGVIIGIAFFSNAFDDKEK